MNQLFVFIYAKDSKIKALNHEDAQMLHNELIKDGWVHTETLDACAYIESLHNDCKDIAGEVKSLSGIIHQCKNIPDKPIIEFLLKHKGHRCNWCLGDEKDVRNAMPKNMASEKLILAKMRQLMKRGLVDGCDCGCRGDFEITNKGEEWLS